MIDFSQFVISIAKEILLGSGKNEGVDKRVDRSTG